MPYYDEMFDGGRRPARRTPRRWRHALEALGPEALATPAGGATRSSCSRASRSTPAGPTPTGRCATGRSRSTSCRGSSRPRSGRTIKRGLAQRIRALNHFVDDVYHGREIVHDGIVPWDADRLALRRSPAPRTGSGRRAASTATSPAATSCATATARGRCSRTTSARRAASPTCSRTACAMTRLLPGLFAHYRVRPVDHYPALLRDALREVAPTGGEEEATVVVWTPGPFNSAYFEHAFLARQMGVELVEASDLVVRDARLLHPHHPRAPARARDLPPDRRRLHGPARVPARLAARRARA